MPKNEILDDEFAQSTFEVYDKFQTVANARPLISLLKSNDIQHKVEQPKPIVDPLFIGDTDLFSPKVFVKLRPQDFQRVNQLIEADMLQQIQAGEIDLKQHFLYEFTNDELWDVIRKPDEWNFDTTIIAKHLLESRGVAVSKAQVSLMTEDRLLKIRAPKKGNVAWIVVLLLLSLLGFSTSIGRGLVTTIICFGMAYYFWQDVTIDPNGKKFYTFDQPTRNWGKWILVLAITVRLAAIVWYFILKS